MSKTLRVLLVGVALIGAAAPAFARGEGGGGGNGGGGGDPGGAFGAWDPTIAGVVIPSRRAREETPVRVAQQQLQRLDTICGLYRGQTVCRPR